MRISKNFLAEIVASRPFKSSSEAIRKSLRMLEETELRFVVLCQKIEAGRKSGKPIAYAADAIKRRGRKTRATETSY
jgi:putative addiction module CopG family antidote